VGAPVSTLDEQIGAELDALREAGTFKTFNAIESPQGPMVEMAGRGEVIVLSSNNYLGLADHPEVVEAGIEGLRKYGAGTASVRFICGTFTPHLELERDLAEMSATESALTYVSCWNANEASIPTLVDETTALISDELNHASIIDAMRLAKPERKVRYKHSDMGELRDALRACDPGQRKLIVTDGVFSWKGISRSFPTSSNSRARTTRWWSSTTRTASA
jgi:glycine C-acetyltransferase